MPRGEEESSTVRSFKEKLKQLSIPGACLSPPFHMQGQRRYRKTIFQRFIHSLLIIHGWEKQTSGATRTLKKLLHEKAKENSFVYRTTIRRKVGC